MAAIDSVYQYYLTTYGNTHMSRYDSHKKSDLRNTYNNILKSNKESPLYKLKDDDGDVKKFAIDIKESARQIKNVIASLSEEGEDIANLFKKRVAVTDQEDVVSVEYIGNGGENENTQSFQMEVKSLAKPQVNMGTFLRSDGKNLAPGSYNFDLSTSSNSYEFQFTVGNDDDNKSVQQKLARLINNANIGLHADVVDGEKDTTALRIESRRTGLNEGEERLFHISPQGSPSSIKALEELGIQNVESEAANSVFLLNGKERSSYANTFTINNAFEVNLKGTSPPGQPATIGFKASADAVADNIQKLTDSYNGILKMAKNYQGTEQQSNKLIADIANVGRKFSPDFENIGLTVGEDNLISIDRDKLKEIVNSDQADQAFQTLNRFKEALGVRADKASIDPMNYVDKVVVAYKNPGKNLGTPYISSMYSGMMLDKGL